MEARPLRCLRDMLWNGQLSLAQLYDEFRRGRRQLELAAPRA